MAARRCQGLSRLKMGISSFERKRDEEIARAQISLSRSHRGGSKEATRSKNAHHERRNADEGLHVVGDAT